jgi:methylthioribose-1-phosphate isomerase
VVAAASTFSKRYAFCNAFGIMTGDEDNEQVLKEGTDEKVRFDSILLGVARATAVELNDVEKKMSTSKKYNAEEKKKFQQAVKQRREQLKKPAPKSQAVYPTETEES